MKTDKHFLSYLAKIFLQWEGFRTKVVEKIKAPILYSIKFFFFRKSYCSYDNVEKYCRVGQATDDNMAHAHCMLYT
jgi:hypothetical protein